MINDSGNLVKHPLSQDCLIGITKVKYQMKNGDIWILSLLPDKEGFEFLRKDTNEQIIYKFGYQDCDDIDTSSKLCSIEEDDDFQLEFSNCGSIDCVTYIVYEDVVLLDRGQPYLEGIAICQ